MARKKNLSEQEEKQLLLLKSTYQMHIKTREEVVLRGKKEAIERMDLIIKDVIAQMAQIDEKFAQDCVKEFQKTNKAKSIVQAITEEDNSGSIMDAIKELSKETGDTVNMFETIVDEFDRMSEDDDEIDDDIDLYAMADQIEDSFEQKVEISQEKDANDDVIYNDVDPDAQHDLIKLPSKGQCYKNKIDRVPVGYLTASDENLITSPNLYESGSITNILLKKKVLNKSIDVENLVSGDVDAIMVFLRGTSYGNMFPIVATDPKTGKKFDTEVDLQQLSYKPFNLQGDENGYFDFVLPLTKAQIKFKFLTKKEEKMLQKLNKKENSGIIAYDLNEAVEKVKNALKTDKVLSDADKSQIIDANNKLEKWATALNKSNQNAMPYTKSITNTMEMEIVSINGNVDRKYIHEFVMKMPASDSLAFRRYIYDNQPGVDFEVTVARPESMGGGSFKCFLEWDDTVFWNIA